MQSDQQEQGHEHEQPSEGQLPKRSQTLFFVKEVDTLPGLQKHLASETPAMPSNIAKTPRVCRTPTHHG